MTLQRINRILIRDFGRWRGEHEFIFEGDRTVITGPNGSGKSTVWTAAALGLLFKTTNAAVAQAFTPIGGGGGNPYVEIDFVASGRELRIEKTFHRTAGVSRFLDLSVQPAVVLEEGDNAVIACRSALTGAGDDGITGRAPRDLDTALSLSLDGQVIDLIMPRQGILSSKYGGNESLQSIGLEPVAEDTNRALQALILHANNALTEVRTSERSNARGLLPTASNALETARTAEATLQSESNNISEWLRHLNELQAEVAEEAGVDETEEEIEELLTEADSHQEDREAAEDILADRTREHADIETLHDDRSGLRESLQSLSDIVTTLTAQEEAHRNRLDEENSRLAARKDTLDDARTLEKRFRDWVSYVERTESVATRTRELEILQADSETYGELLDEAAEKTAEIDSIDIASDEQWERLRKIKEEVMAITGAADAWSITEFSPGPDHVILVDDELTDETPDSVSTSIEVKDGQGESRLRVENTRSLDDINGLQSEEVDILSELGAEGTAELNQRKTRFDALTGQLVTVHDRIQVLNDRMSNDDRTENIATLNASLGSEIEEPDSERPPDDENWTERLVEFKGELHTAEEVYGNSEETARVCENTLTESRANLTTRTTDLDAKQEEVDAHVDEHGTDDELVTLLAEAAVRMGDAADVARPLTNSRSEEEEQKRQRAAALQTTITEGRDTRRRITELRAMIRDKRENGGLENLGQVQADRLAAEQRVDELELEQDALSAVLAALNAVREANIEEIRPRVIGTIRHGASYVFGEPDLQIDLGDDGFPIAVQHVQGQAIPFERESFGTQEQLNLIYRVAIASIIAEDMEHGLCIILDDPFGQTDVHRRRRMLEWIGARLDEAGHQLILFTCRGGDFEGFGQHDDIRQH
jgi:DNA repair exonuclease SbcCD ATPase subunit